MQSTGNTPKKINRTPILECRRKLAAHFKAYRLKQQGKTTDEIAIILNVSKRAARRMIEKFMEWLNTYCSTSMVFKMNAHDLGFTCENEKRDYLENHSPRRAA